MSSPANTKFNDRLFKVSVILILGVALLAGAMILSRYSSIRSDELAYESQGVIYTADRNGLHIRPVTGSDMEAYSPAWSPDGTRIAFVGQPTNAMGAQFSVYVLNLSDLQIERLTKAGDVIAGTLGSPTWSPDGKSIAFAGTIGAGDWKLYILDVDTKQLSHLADGLVEPRWSPNGQLIVADGGGSICVLQVADRSKQCFVLVGAEDPEYSFWFQDGSRIGFIGSQPNGIGLYSVALDGSDLQELLSPVPLGLCDPVWVPNENFIVLARCEEQAHGLYTLEPGSNRLNQLNSLGFGPWAKSPTWKPVK